ncbi:ribosylnicotinamide kinase [Emydomyces testavorans]|uniref:Ribosylnicotinamide kinase n=1 Tax=Emydomyces testavorans TaxID=2070801 RepID=A0AAF0DM59_9EURO|nr:ribosylnicotinamide kinase [Emydomyces testavorans]
MDPKPQKTLIVGLSGPSSSGKTTLARLLRTVFTPPPSADGTPAATTPTIRPFILHEDDFYKPDDQLSARQNGGIPMPQIIYIITTTSSGHPVQDWDTLDALDIPQLQTTLAYIRAHGNLPAGLKSKEDLNNDNDSASAVVDPHTVHSLRNELFSQRLTHNAQLASSSSCPPLALALIDGFLLYAPPPHDNAAHPLRAVHDAIDVPLFLPATYTRLKQRREGRTGYVTVGPAPTPTPTLQSEKKECDDGGERLGGAGEKRDANADAYIPPETSFWTDPPGYVDEIVWPRYITDHAWLLVPPESRGGEMDVEELKRVVGEGGNVREDAGVIVAPGMGEASMEELLRWAVGEVLKAVEDMLR